MEIEIGHLREMISILADSLIISLVIKSLSPKNKADGFAQLDKIGSNP
mgnify:CR=1 FL=1